MFNFIKNKDKVIAFTKKNNKDIDIINNMPRIFLGYKINNTIMKIGYFYMKTYGKYQMRQVLIEINYDINICSINFNHMKKQDIILYKSL